LKPHLRRKIEAWRHQACALGAEDYRITLIPRRGGRPWNPGNRQDGSKTFFSVEDVESWMPLLAGRNAEGWDIYCTPIDPTCHHIVLDDATEETLRAFQAETGIRPSWVQQSSPGNLQAIVLATKIEATRAEQSAANQVVMDLNRRFGDPSFSGVVHPFRMAGFCNAKPEHAGRQRPLVRYRDDVVTIGPPGSTDPAADDRLTAARKKCQERHEDDGRGVHRDGAPPPSFDTTTSIAKAWRTEHEKIRAWVEAQGWPVDRSSIDYRAVTNLLAAGVDTAAIEATVAADPEVGARQWDPTDYARRTVRAAMTRGTGKAFSPPRGGAAGLCSAGGRDGGMRDG
jgi:hypothetical protein